MSVLNLTNDNFNEQVMNSDKPVLIDFFASWCGPCARVSPLVDEIAKQRPDVKVCKVDVDEQGELAARFGVCNIPTLIVIKDSKISAKNVGAVPKAEILDMIDR